MLSEGLLSARAVLTEGLTAVRLAPLPVPRSTDLSFPNFPRVGAEQGLLLLTDHRAQPSSITRPGCHSSSRTELEGKCDFRASSPVLIPRCVVDSVNTHQSGSCCDRLCAETRGGLRQGRTQTTHVEGGLSVNTLEMGLGRRTGVGGSYGGGAAEPQGEGGRWTRILADVVRSQHHSPRPGGTPAFLEGTSPLHGTPYRLPLCVVRDGNQCLYVSPLSSHFPTPCLRGEPLVPVHL